MTNNINKENNTAINTRNNKIFEHIKSYNYYLQHSYKLNNFSDFFKLESNIPVNLLFEIIYYNSSIKDKNTVPRISRQIKDFASISCFISNFVNLCRHFSDYYFF